MAHMALWAVLRGFGPSVYLLLRAQLGIQCSGASLRLRSEGASSIVCNDVSRELSRQSETLQLKS